ncbi:MAG TPA: alkaline phosphatase D family protein [Melioribacteraceae bacterium]|nr:alkaline phosphatase D family protein [Melioribacteraceae bacterium]
MKSIKILLTVLFIFCLSSLLMAQDLLQSGPMVGYSSMREVGLWVQTSSAAKVKFAYWNINSPKKKYFTDEFSTTKTNWFTAKLIADQLEPGQKYNYQLYINGKPVKRNYDLKFQTQKLWQWRENPPDFSFATGSCFYVNETVYDRPGRPYGSDYQIMTSIYKKNPDFMIWLGDNFYLREVDWDSWTGILKRITHTRSLPELQPVLGSMHHYAIWDDHDFGPNDSDRGYYLKEKTLDANKLFWGNPTFGFSGKESMTTYFQWGDVDFFLLDGRYFRTPNNRKTGNRELLGDEQIRWLIDNLISSRAPFKIIAVGGQVLNPVDDKPFLETYDKYPEEKAKLMALLEDEKIEGVVFLTGDRHHSELTKLPRENSYPLYDFTISSLTAGVSPGKDEKNFLRVPGTLADQHNFAVFGFSGQSKNRLLKCTVYDSDGKELWNYSINENELKYKK